MKNLEAKIAAIMDEFDWVKVQQTMKALAWTYFDKVGTPEIKDLKELADKLLRDVSSDRFIPGDSVNCGGFEARRMSKKHLSLHFIVTEMDSQDYRE